MLNELGELGKAPWERGNWRKAGEGLTMRPSEREVWGGGRAWGGVEGAAAPEGALPRSEANLWASLRHQPPHRNLPVHTQPARGSFCS